MRAWRGGVGVVLIVALLHGCGGAPVEEETGFAPDAVPRVEPKSKYGNMESYVVFGQRYYPQASSRGYVARGLASWYGPGFDGQRASSGEIYDMHAMTAAHKTLPLPTYAQVINLENGRMTVVKINDRGPFHGDRLLDLSYEAASKLGIVRNGTAMVEVRSVDPRDHGGPVPLLSRQTALAMSTQYRASLAPVAAPRLAVADRRAGGGDLYLQVGAFGDQDNAEQLRHRLLAYVPEPISIRPEGDPTLYRVRVGPLGSAAHAENLSRKLTELGLQRALVIDR